MDGFSKQQDRTISKDQDWHPGATLLLVLFGGSACWAIIIWFVSLLFDAFTVLP